MCAYVESGISGGGGGGGVGPKVRTRELYGVASCVASAIINEVRGPLLGVKQSPAHYYR